MEEEPVANGTTMVGFLALLCPSVLECDVRSLDPCSGIYWAIGLRPVAPVDQALDIHPQERADSLRHI